MATTYNKIETALRFAQEQSDWIDFNKLASYIRSQKHRNFRVRLNGKKVDDFMKVESIEELLKFIHQLKLLSQRKDGTLILTKNGRDCLASDDAYDRQLRSSIKSYLEDRNLPLSKIGDAIVKIKDPEIANAKAIYDKLPKEKTAIGERQIRLVLFLLFKCEGIDRDVRVQYSLKIE